MKGIIFSAVLMWTASVQAQTEAVTATGEKVLLLPNGRWEYVDQKKAQVQREAVRAETERERSAQGGMFGIGRQIPPGDKDYNRGSLGRK